MLSIKPLNGPVSPKNSAKAWRWEQETTVIRHERWQPTPVFPTIKERKTILKILQQSRGLQVRTKNCCAYKVLALRQQDNSLHVVNKTAPPLPWTRHYLQVRGLWDGHQGGLVGPTSRFLVTLVEKVTLSLTLLAQHSSQNSSFGAWCDSVRITWQTICSTGPGVKTARKR